MTESQPETPADRLRRYGLTVSENGARCAEFVEWFYGGFHHFPGGHAKLMKTKWSDRFVTFVHRNGDLCSYDSADLTRMVLIAHDLGIRVEVEPAMRFLRITLHPRDPDGVPCGWHGHPTMEGALAEWRKRNPPRVEPTKVRAGY